MNHALIPSISKATLPVKYEAAKLAITEASRIDECKDWSDKAAALASYARQSGDTEMEDTAHRIRSRAVKRCGQLIEEIEKAQGKHWESKRAGADPSTLTRGQAAAAAGLSPRRAKEAVRVARVPEELFEELVEGEKPPTVTALAKLGTAKANGVPHYVTLGMTKEQFIAATHGGGSVNSFATKIQQYDPSEIAAGSTKEERKKLRESITIIMRYLKKLRSKL